LLALRGASDPSMKHSWNMEHELQNATPHSAHPVLLAKNIANNTYDQCTLRARRPPCTRAVFLSPQVPSAGPLHVAHTARTGTTSCSGRETVP
jgi:hypothetical protein